MKPSHAQWLKRLPALFEIPAPDPPRLLRRIVTMERNIMLPVKAVFIAIIFYSFDVTAWVGLANSTLDVVVETVQLIFWFYILANIILAMFLLAAERLPLAVVQWTVVTSNFVDGIFIAGMALLTGGLDSVFFWLFVALIIRNSVSVPPGVSQLISNFVISLCYALVAVLDVSVFQNLDDNTRRALDLTTHGDLGQPFVVRLVVLLLTTICCSGLELLLERQRLAAEEAGEFAAREGQLRSAGRLAAEFAHQIKNPLAIINNAAFSLQRAAHDGKNQTTEQIEIIQEEVARADKVITQIMGYAQLSEGRVEKLNVIEELDRAVTQVFPPAVPDKIKIHREFGHAFPPLLMQRGHLSEILVNLLQNAREALGEKGNVFVSADCRHDYSVEISVRDDGPGIPPEKTERIFEAYFTTKEKGSGLGLSIVKHNVELYGGNIRLESKLGQGAKFTLIFPAKALMKLNPK
ncbi:MAG TPA: HAMP domain-containing sensor histidine kinase [Verrucomicrobiae bacterium]|jgi:signal transduction histidine kinase|nr:HAMP domain-containing sensor histidine kinase [Verrucomicrobiae bacterium]